MPITLENPAGNTPQGGGANNSAPQAEEFDFTDSPAPGLLPARKLDGVVVLYSSLPGATAEMPAAEVLQGNLIGTESAWHHDWLIE